jgi:epoxide hydrolase
MLIHGWPGSIVEFLDIIAPLADPRATGGTATDAFDLVIPSLTGHALSGPVSEPGVNDARIAAAFTELMSRLGYDRYGVQGGDAGARIAPEMDGLEPERVIGVHLNALLTFPSGDAAEMAELTDAKRGRLGRLQAFRDDGMGYIHIQGSRPRSLAYGLTDSPAGQLAWIVEKFKEWSDPASDRPVLATLIRHIGDFQLAEDAVQDA